MKENKIDGLKQLLEEYRQSSRDLARALLEDLEERLEDLEDCRGYIRSLEWAVGVVEGNVNRNQSQQGKRG